MNFKFLITLLFIGINLQSYCQTSLVGNWRRVMPTIKNQDFKNKKKQLADLEIRPDSTFEIYGDTMTRNSKVSGWDVWEGYTGTWEEHDNRFLILWIGLKKDKMRLPFTIIKLTKDKLVLGMPGSSKTEDITYLRL